MTDVTPPDIVDAYPLTPVQAGILFSALRAPDTGLFVLAIDPGHATPGFAASMAEQAARLSQDHGIYIPGPRKAAQRRTAQAEGLEIAEDLLSRLRALTDV